MDYIATEIEQASVRRNGSMTFGEGLVARRKLGEASIDKTVECAWLSFKQPLRNPRS